MSTRTARANIWAEFEAIRIKHPRSEAAHAAFSDVRALKRAHPSAPQRFISIFAPSHSGKSMSVKTYIEKYVVDDAISRGLFKKTADRQEIARLQHLVTHVTLSANATPKSLASDILRAYGDEWAAHGTTTTLLARSYDLMHAAGTELLVIDEIQHLSGARGRAANRSQDHGTSVTDTLKAMMIRGLVPMVFIGVEEARHHLFNDPQLVNRCLMQLDFGCLDYTRGAERKIFEDYCGRLGIKLKEHGLFRRAADLLRDDIPGCLHVVSRGRIGVVSRLVEQATVVASQEEAGTLLRHHLVRAVDEWAIPQGIIDYNPFTNGLRTMQKRRA